MVGFTVGPLPGQDDFGAVVSGLTPESLDDPATRQALYDLWIDKGLIVFRDTDGLDTHLKLSGNVKASHLNHMQYDRILCTDALMKDDPSRSDLVFKSSIIRRDLVVRGKEQDKDHMDIFWQIPQEERDISDHYPLVAEFEVK